jgi:hypothetical protein
MEVDIVCEMPGRKLLYLRRYFQKNKESATWQNRNGSGEVS